MPSGGFELIIPAIERPQTYALGRAVIAIINRHIEPLWKGMYIEIPSKLREAVVKLLTPPICYRFQRLSMNQLIVCPRTQTFLIF